MVLIPVRFYSCTSSCKGYQQRRHIWRFGKEFEKQLLFSCCVKVLKWVRRLCLLFLRRLCCRCGLRCTITSIKLFLESCGIYTAVIVQDMRIPFCNHCCLCMACITLNGLNIATTEFEFVGRTCMPETMENHLGKIVIRDKFAKGPIDII